MTYGNNTLPDAHETNGRKNSTISLSSSTSSSSFSFCCRSSLSPSSSGGETQTSEGRTTTKLLQRSCQQQRQFEWLAERLQQNHQDQLLLRRAQSAVDAKTMEPAVYMVSSTGWKRSNSMVEENDLTDLNWLQNMNPYRLEKQQRTVASHIQQSVQPQAGCMPSQHSFSKAITQPLAFGAQGNLPSEIHQSQPPSVSTPSIMLGFNADEAWQFRTNPHQKPPFSYTSLICMAMKDIGREKVSLAEIYTWITDHFIYYRLADGSWQNSVRHNLSLNKCFEKIPRRKDEPGKGGFWRLNPKYGQLTEGSQTRRTFQSRTNPAPAQVPHHPASMPPSEPSPSKRLRLCDDFLNPAVCSRPAHHRRKDPLNCLPSERFQEPDDMMATKKFENFNSGANLLLPTDEVEAPFYLPVNNTVPEQGIFPMPNSGKNVIEEDSVNMSWFTNTNVASVEQDFSTEAPLSLQTSWDTDITPDPFWPSDEILSTLDSTLQQQQQNQQLSNFVLTTQPVSTTPSSSQMSQFTGCYEQGPGCMSDSPETNCGDSLFPSSYHDPHSGSMPFYDFSAHNSFNELTDAWGIC